MDKGKNREKIFSWVVVSGSGTTSKLGTVTELQLLLYIQLSSNKLCTISDQSSSQPPQSLDNASVMLTISFSVISLACLEELGPPTQGKI